MQASPPLDREFLPTRAKILEIAATLDRLGRTASDAQQDARLQLLRDGIQLLVDKSENRAEAVQLLFSRSYDPSWREQFQL